MLDVPLLSIIIVNYNGSALLQGCLASIYATAADLAPEVWVVDNASSDDSVAMVRAQFPQVQLIVNSENLGFAAANNQALAQASSVYLLLLNNDTLVHEMALQEMLNAMEAHPEVGALGPLLRNRDGTLQPSCLGFPSVFRAPFSYLRAQRGGTGKFAPTDTQELTPVNAVVGACLLIRRATLEQVGLLDEGYFFYAEEVDWCYRAKVAGWQVAFLPTAEVTHLGGQTASREADRFYVERRWSRVRYHWKHHGAWAARIDATMIRANIWLNGLRKPAERARFERIAKLFAQRLQALRTEAATSGFAKSTKRAG